MYSGQEETSLEVDCPGASRGEVGVKEAAGDFVSVLGTADYLRTPGQIAL